MTDSNCFTAWETTNISVKEDTLQTGEFVTYYRVWGEGPHKALFLHGGPGQSVEDYGQINHQILNPSKYTVVEVDQLGTGRSEPSVRKGLHHAKIYRKIRAQDFVEAITQVLDKLGWEKVFLHGGSWGSSLALLFAQMKPERVTGMVIRGIFTGTLPEMNVTYTAGGAVNDNMKEAFSHIFEFAKSKGYTGGDNDAKAFVSFFRDLMTNGTPEDQDMAAWNWWVQELWVVGEKEFNFNEIDPKNIEEARSVAFFEAHIFYEILWGDKPIDFLNVDLLPKVPVWIVQGKGDDVCPPKYAQKLEELLTQKGFQVNATYVEDGHKVTGNNIRNSVRNAAVQFSTN